MNVDQQNIVWLASYPKSGNTWFRVFISNLFNENEKVDLNELQWSTIASSRYLFESSSGTSSSDLAPQEIEDLRPKVYRDVALNAEEIMFIKVHDAWKRTHSGQDMFPKDITKKVIYIIRNPLDVAVSFAFHTGNSPEKMVTRISDANNALSKKPDRLFNQIKQDLLDWSGHVSSWIDESGLPVHIMRYEDMLSNTFETFQHALEALGIHKTGDQIQKAMEASDFSILSEAEIKDGFKEKPIEMKSFFRSGKAGNWREHLSEKDVNALIEKHGRLMKRFGYLTENNPVF